jgi:hypothetical protein
MNKRIRELIEQATTEEHDGFMYFDKKKFAELIVGHATECVRDVLRDENSDLSYAAAEQVQNRIKEFFGVEE